MRRVTIPLQGREMPLCFSLRVMKSCGEHFGGLEGLDGALSARDGDAIQTLCSCVWLLSQMLEAGYRYDQANGAEAVKPPDEEDLLDCFGMDDLAALQRSLMEAMGASNTRTVEADAPKNAGAAPEAAAS